METVVMTTEELLARDAEMVRESRGVGEKSSGTATEMEAPRVATPVAVDRTEKEEKEREADTTTTTTT